MTYVILENWISAGLPCVGRGYNAYNVSLKRREQLCVEQGDAIVLVPSKELKS